MGVACVNQARTGPREMVTEAKKAPVTPPRFLTRTIAKNKLKFDRSTERFEFLFFHQRYFLNPDIAFVALWLGWNLGDDGEIGTSARANEEASGKHGIYSGPAEVDDLFPFTLMHIY
eukprot:319889-Amorphochlora_amoeboformis.AAC.1